MNDAAIANDEFTAFWNDVLVEKFERFRNILLDGLSLHSRIPFRTLDVPRGSKVLDVGCGWGDTAIELARMTGPQGSVLGLDCCDAFLEKGRADARAAGLANVRFVEADVQTYRFAPEFDLCFSRFGMMFFSESRRRHAQRPDRAQARRPARLHHVAHARRQRLWLGLPKHVVLNFLPPPGEDAATCGPGPFSMANPDVVSAQLKAAGFVDPTYARVDGPVMVGPRRRAGDRVPDGAGPRRRDRPRSGRGSRAAQGRDRARVARRDHALPAGGRLDRHAVELVDDHRTQSGGAIEPRSDHGPRAPGRALLVRGHADARAGGFVRARRRRRQSGPSRSASTRRPRASAG